MSQLVSVSSPSNAEALLAHYQAARTRLRGPANLPVQNSMAKRPEASERFTETVVKPDLIAAPGPVDSVASEGAAKIAVAIPFVPPSTVIIRRIAKEFGVTPEDIRGQERGKTISRIRHAAMYACIVETKLSYPQVGAAFNRDHSTVVSAVQRHCHRTGAALPRGLPPGNLDAKRRRAREYHRVHRAK